MRPIDADALLREMTKLCNERTVEAAMTGNRACCVTWDDAVHLIRVAPTIEAEPKIFDKDIDAPDKNVGKMDEVGE